MPSNNNIAYHNTIVMPSGAYYIIGLNSGATQNQIYNNILISESGNVPAEDSNTGSYTGLQSDYNLFDASGLTTQRSRSQDSHSLSATLAQTFQNSSQRNYQLLSTSQAINNGTLSHTSTPDLAGLSRPQGTLPDMGAYEYSQTTPTLTPNITLTKSVNRTQAASGEEITYAITYNNTGNGNATNVVINDPIPTGATYVAGSASNGGVLNSGTLTWTIGNVAAGGSGSVSFRVKVD